MGDRPGDEKTWFAFRLVVTAAFLISAAVVTGCQAINPLPQFGIGEASPEEKRINRLIEWHSGRVAVYHDFKTVFTARAVYLSDEIREIAMDWEARTKLLSPEERIQMEKRYNGEDEPLIRVLMGFYTPSEEVNDLDEENTAWVPYLKNQDGSIRKATCLSLEEDEARIYMRFLRWDLSWSKLYLLCFPSDARTDESAPESVTMVISGPLGQGEVKLRIKPPQDSQ